MSNLGDERPKDDKNDINVDINDDNDDDDNDDGDDDGDICTTQTLMTTSATAISPSKVNYNEDDVNVSHDIDINIVYDNDKNDSDNYIENSWLIFNSIDFQWGPRNTVDLV